MFNRNQQNKTQPKKETLVFFEEGTNPNEFFQCYHDDKKRFVLTQDYPTYIQAQLYQLEIMATELANKRGKEYEAIQSYPMNLKRSFLSQKLQYVNQLKNSVFTEIVNTTAFSVIAELMQNIKTKYDLYLDIDYNLLNDTRPTFYNVPFSNDKFNLDYTTGIFVTKIVPETLQRLYINLNSQIRQYLYSTPTIDISVLDKYYNNIEMDLCVAMRKIEEAVLYQIIPLIQKLDYIGGIYTREQHKIIKANAMEDDDYNQYTEF